MMRTSTAAAVSRILESAGQAVLILLLLLAGAGRLAADARLATVATAILLVLTATAYAFHALTFDAFRLTGHRHRRPETLGGAATAVRRAR
jgi:peptidoglycan/LPS O-acetylase OafA/YrhL